MANQEPTKLVLRRMTKSELINLGGNKFIYTKRWTWMWSFIFSFGFGLIMQHFYKQSFTMNVISLTPFVVVTISFFYTLNKAGKKFWNEIKDKGEPVEIK